MANASVKGSVIVFPDGRNQIKARLNKAGLKASGAIQAYFNSKTSEFEEYMKANAPWTDRTGDARRGLKATVSWSKAGYVSTMELSHSVYYGVYLELSMEKRFAIIEPTVRVKGPDLMSGVGAIMTSTFG